MTTSRGSRAFTLVEVLVSLALLALAAVVLGAAYANTLEAHRAAAQRAGLGEPLGFLREAVLLEPDRAKVEEGGDLVLPGNRRLRWSAAVEETAVPDLFRVVVTGTAETEAGRGAEEFAQSLHLLRPTWSDAGRRDEIRQRWRDGRRAREERR